MLANFEVYYCIVGLCLCLFGASIFATVIVMFAFLSGADPEAEMLQDKLYLWCKQDEDDPKNSSNL